MSDRERNLKAYLEWLDQMIHSDTVGNSYRAAAVDLLAGVDDERAQGKLWCIALEGGGVPHHLRGRAMAAAAPGVIVRDGAEWVAQQLVHPVTEVRLSALAALANALPPEEVLPLMPADPAIYGKVPLIDALAKAMEERKNWLSIIPGEVMISPPPTGMTGVPADLGRAVSEGGDA